MRKSDGDGSTLKTKTLMGQAPIAILLIIILLGIYMRTSINFHENIRDTFCQTKGFDKASHELQTQLFFCYKEQNGEKAYMASYDVNYSLFDSASSCSALQFKNSKICLVFMDVQTSCGIPTVKTDEACKK